MQDKAYKLLALQENISNNQAKELIDNGCVFSHGKKITIARALMSSKTKFNVLKIKEPSVIFEDENILAINKPCFYLSENLEKKYNLKLLNRLDKETSGVILLCKDDEFKEKCIQEFKKQNVYKSYIAILDGVLAEETQVNEPILTIKNKNGAYSKINKNGLPACSVFIPLMINSKKTLAKIVIKTGRTHQIRVHANFLKTPILGDEKYGKSSSARMYLHSFELGIFDYLFKAKLDQSFNVFEFDIKNLDF